MQHGQSAARCATGPVHHAFREYDPAVPGEGQDRVVYRITIKRGGTTITSLTLQTDDPDQAVKVARLEFDLQKSQRGATSVVLTEQGGKVAYRFPQHEKT